MRQFLCQNEENKQLKQALQKLLKATELYLLESNNKKEKLKKLKSNHIFYCDMKSIVGEKMNMENTKSNKQ